MAGRNEEGQKGARQLDLQETSLSLYGHHIKYGWKSKAHECQYLKWQTIDYLCTELLQNI